MKRGALTALLGALALGHDHDEWPEWDTGMNEAGEPLPDLSGSWRSSSGELYGMFHDEDLTLPAVRPNSTYTVSCVDACSNQLDGRCTLWAEYNYTSRNRTGIQVSCNMGNQDAIFQGYLDGEPANGTIIWGPQPVQALQGKANDPMRWQRAPNVPFNAPRNQIHTVHMVFANHYDVGYTASINDVDNVYMHEYFSRAAATAATMRQNASGDGFVYMTHPWLMYRFLNCPCPDAATACPARSLDNTRSRPLVCPNQTELDLFDIAARRGDIVWNAAPSNLQVENMSPELFEAGILNTMRMDLRFRPQHNTATVSIRDVMYVTRSIIPMLNRHKISGLTIGSNGAGVPPQVPKLHRWVDPQSGQDVVVAYHPYGYGGYGLADCAESPNGFALCTEFRTDNTGPPVDAAEVEAVLAKARQEYPNAKVFASSFDAFMADVMPVKDQLPVVTQEVGDTWMYGAPSDPLKMAQHRAIQRVWIQCLKTGNARCGFDDPAIVNMTFFLLKAPEHTWGTPGISGWGSGNDYNVTLFRSKLNDSAYLNASASWAEQRFYNELAVKALEEAQHPLAAAVRHEVDSLSMVKAPNLASLGYQQVSITEEVVIGHDGIRVAFDSTGAITTLVDWQGIHWASAVTPLAAFVYKTFDETDWQPFTYAYCTDHQEQAGFCKPGSANFSESADWRPVLKEVWSSQTSGDVYAVMDMPDKSWQQYGAPQRMLLRVAHVAGGPAGLAPTLLLELTWLNKRPTMIGEASMLTFQPAPTQIPMQANNLSCWRLEKLGGQIDPEDVIDGGCQYNHGVWGGALGNTKEGLFYLESLDAPNMNPMVPDFPFGNPLPATTNVAKAKAGKGLAPLEPGSVFGMAVNLHNNLWNTNYPLYYPYYDPHYCSDPWTCADSNLRFRFRLTLGGASAHSVAGSQATTELIV